MRMLVTGGAGFIGSNLVCLLVNEGYQVTVLDNLSSGYRRNLEPFADIHLVDADIRDAEAVARAMQGVEVVFHMAASVGNVRSIQSPIQDSEVNVIGTLRVLEAARLAGARKVVFSSSAGIFGELKTLPIREDHAVEPDSPYGASKLAGEKLCLAYAKLYNMEAVALRYFNVYGLNQRYDAYGNAIPIFTNRILTGQQVVIFGDGEQTRDFVNVRDVVMANRQAGLAVGLSGAFNLGSGTRITINRLVELLGLAAGREVPVVHQAPRKGDVRHSLAEITAAVTSFGYQVTVPLEQGLTDYVAWASSEMARG